MSETLAVSNATALQQLHLQAIGKISQTFFETLSWILLHNCLQFLIVMTTYPSSAFFIFKALINTTEFLEAPLYCLITCIPISP